MSAIARWFGTLREIATEAHEQEITFLAAAIAYYAFVSILPLLLLALAIASFLAGEQFATRLVTAASDVLTPAGQTELRDFILGQRGRSGATVVGTLVLLWSTLRVFRGLDESFSRVYDVDVPKGFVEQVADALVVLATIALAVGAMVVVGVAIARLPDVPFQATLSALALFVALLPVFLPLYYFFPDVEMSVREALPGAVVATVGWTGLQVGFRIYVQNASQFDVYGVLGGALLLVTWLYLGAILLLAGAVVNAVLSDRFVPEDEGGNGYLQDRRRRERHVRATSMTGPTTADDEGDGGDPHDGDGGDRHADDRGERHDEGADVESRHDEGADLESRPAPDVAALADEVAALGADLDAFADEVEARTVDREAVERELQRYVRHRIARGHARGWGPYLVLLYGTAMTLGAFYWLRGGWSILAMLVVWTSTLGVYVLMVLFGFSIGALGLPKRLLDRFRSGRS